MLMLMLGQDVLAHVPLHAMNNRMKKWRADLGACSALFLFANLPLTRANPIGVSSRLSIPLRCLPLDFGLPSWPHDETAVEPPLARHAGPLGNRSRASALTRNRYLEILLFHWQLAISISFWCPLYLPELDFHFYQVLLRTDVRIITDCI